MNIETENLIRQTAQAIVLDDAPPRRIELIPTGRFRTADARGEFDLRDPAGVVARSMAHAKGGALLIDFGHGVQGAADRRSDAAGWITGLEIEGARVMASVEWTPAGAAAIRDKSYRFISPVFFNRPDGEVVLISGAGLVNDPGLPQLRQLAHKEHQMDFTKIAAALGLQPDATENEIIAAINAARAPEQQLASVLEAAGVEALTDDTARQICTRLTAEPDPAQFVPRDTFDDVSRQLASLQKQQGEQSVDDAVGAAMAAGKISPAMEGWARQYASRDLDGFEAFLTGAPVLVQPGRASPDKPTATRSDVLTDAERQICSATGISPEAFLKTRNMEAGHGQN